MLSDEELTILYDLANGSYDPTLPLPGLCIALVAGIIRVIATTLYKRAQEAPNVPSQRLFLNPHHLISRNALLRMSLFVSLGAFVVSILLFGATYNTFQRYSNLAESDTRRIIGTITEIDEGSNVFSVDRKTFNYGDRLLDAAFAGAGSYVGELKVGMSVRVTAVDNTVLRLAILGSDPLVPTQN
jgi:hypothetical protein